MNANLPHYLTGEEVHAGDRVRYKGNSGNIAFVSDGDGGEFAAGYTDYYGYESGVMFCNDDGELSFIIEPNEDLEFIGCLTSGGGTN